MVSTPQKATCNWANLIIRPEQAVVTILNQIYEVDFKGSRRSVMVVPTATSGLSRLYRTDFFRRCLTRRSPSRFCSHIVVSSYVSNDGPHDARLLLAKFSPACRAGS